MFVYTKRVHIVQIKSMYSYCPSMSHISYIQYTYFHSLQCIYIYTYICSHTREPSPEVSVVIPCAPRFLLLPPRFSYMLERRSVSCICSPVAVTTPTYRPMPQVFALHTDRPLVRSCGKRTACMFRVIPRIGVYEL